MPQLLLTSEAEESRIQIWLHVAQDSPDAADRLLERIDEKCRLYATQPEMGSPRPDLGRQVRCFSVGNYVVIYRPLEDGILILLVIHGARDIPTVFRELFRRL
ncbi:MAG TPA: type II toxin-antitoxin system RelE/ParE family toxin [Candidatus Anammoximicrobium sp.]|nr:type II toxin-antitoxin system RelE/ParE family toxin [Candidatus Anammoximicrobium sp.]